MTTTCPSGHVSATADYCDQCGARVDASAVRAPPEPRRPSEPSPAEALGKAADPCPSCGAPRGAADRFCEGCGYDFVAGSSGEATAPAPAARHRNWEAVVTADLRYFESQSPQGIDFPDDLTEHWYALDKHELRIGRRKSSTDERQEVDIPAAREDPAVSRVHAVLVRQDDSYAVVDRESTNGTSINDDPTKIAANVPIPLADGDRVHVGAWTTITVRRAADGTGGT